MIKRIKIRDFKSIRDLEVELGPVTVLIGRSGTGKSNFVQAIRFLRNLLVDAGRAITHEGGWPRIVPAGETLPRTSIDVTFSLPGEDDDYRYALEFGLPSGQSFRGQIELTSECLAVGGTTLFSRERKNHRQQGWLWEWKQQPEVVVVPQHSNTPMIGAFPSLQKVVFAHAGLSTGVGYYHFPSSTFGLPWQSVPSSEQMGRIPGLNDDARNFLEVMRSIAQNFHLPNLRKSLLATVQAVNSSISSIELDSISNPQRAVVAHKANGRIFDLSLDQESDGLRRFYAHLLALYQTPPKLTMVFEEPENAIFPGALALLADEFKAAPREHRGQVILTTHSPALLDAFDVDCVRAVEMKEGKTIVGPVASEQQSNIKAHLLTTGELLTVEQPRTDAAQAGDSGK